LPFPPVGLSFLFDPVCVPRPPAGLEVWVMTKACEFTGRTVSFGNSKQYRGKAKYLGGVGKKITGISRRKFKPNLQKVKCVIDGETRKVWVSAAAIRSGLVVKPLKRQPFGAPQV
jgi:large subunit ribosomal protein L28